jgi:hypothetical protein
MSERGGWLVAVEEGGRIRLLMVANKDLEEANKLAIAYTQGGTVINSTEISIDTVQAANMQPNDVRESADLSEKELR